MAGKGEFVRNFLQSLLSSAFTTLPNYVCLSMKVNKSALRSYTALTLNTPFHHVAAFNDWVRMDIDADLCQRRTLLHQLGRWKRCSTQCNQAWQTLYGHPLHSVLREMRTSQG
jgi:hypothetical protein